MLVSVSECGIVVAKQTCITLKTELGFLQKIERPIYLVTF